MLPLRVAAPLLFIASAVVLVILSARTAHAEPVAAALQWRATPGSPCLREQALVRRVERRLGRKVFLSLRKADLVIRGRAWRAPTTWRAELMLRTADGHTLGRRALQNARPACAGLNEMLVLVVAIFVDLSRNELQALRTASAERRPPVPQSGKHPRRRSLPSARRPPGPWAFQARLGVIGSIGLLPAPGIGLALGETVDAPGLWPIDASLALWPAVSSPDGRGQFAAWIARVRTCPTPVHTARVELGACAGIGAGAMRGTGQRLAVARSRARALGWAEATLRAAVRVVGPLWVRMELGAAVPWVRDRFFVHGAGGMADPVHRAAPVVGLGGLAIGVHAP